jgi:O-acetyl-ADP-ribose deacetylase (regulator of RNase III)
MNLRIQLLRGDKAAEIAVRTVKEFLVEHPEFKEVVFVCFDQENYDFYMSLL